MSFQEARTVPPEESQEIPQQRQQERHLSPQKAVPDQNEISFTEIPHNENHEERNTKYQSSPAQAAQSRLWKPLVLKYWFLISFGVFACVCLASIEAIYQVSVKQQGLVTSIRERYYLWTYGPTAIFTLVLAAWAQVEFRTKQLNPWMRMLERSTPASASVLLNYVSKPQINVFPSALKHGDYAVALATAGTIMVTLLIVFSTALFSLETTPVEYSHSFQLQSSFFNNAEGLANIGALPSYIVTGVSFYNLQYPYGTNDIYAFQVFNSTDLPVGSTMRANVDAFTAWLDCEEADLRVDQWTVLGIYNTPASVAPQTFQQAFASTTSCIASVILGEGIVGDDRNIIAYSMQASCSNSTAADDQRLFLLIAEYEAGPTTGQPEDPNTTDSYTTETNYTITQSTQFFCKPAYTVTKVEVTLNNTDATTASAPLIRPVNGVVNRTLTGLHPWDVARAQIEASSGVETIPPPGLDSIQGGDVYYAALRRPGVTADDLFDANLLRSVFGDYYTAMAAQIAHRALASTSHNLIQGTAFINKERLVVKELSVRIMEALLAILALCSFAIVFLTPSRGVTARDPSSLIGFAALLSRSQPFLESLKGMGEARMRDIRPVLLDKTYISSTSSISGSLDFKLEQQTRSSINEKQRSTIEAHQSIKYWQPFVLSPYVRFGACVLVLGVIAGLEICLHLSQQNQGLADVQLEGSTHYVWAYVPALVMVSVSLFTSSVDFATRVFAPFSVLKDRSTFGRSMSISFLNKMALPAIWSALTLRHWPVVLSASAMTISSFLTIIVSGVFSTTSVPTQQTVQLSRQTWFNLSSEAAGTPYNDGSTQAGLILNANMSYTAWTWDELALAELVLANADYPSASDEQVPAISNFTSLSLRAPAIRSVLNCTSYSGIAALNASITDSPYENNPGYMLNMAIPGDDWCQTWGLAQSVFVEPETGIFGFYQDTDVRECPHFVYFWGRLESLAINHVAAMACSERVAEVEVDIEFLYPSFTIDPTTTPVQDDSTMVFHELGGVYVAANFLPNVTTTSGTFDVFFSNLILNKDGIPASDLGSSTEDTKVQEAIRHVHYLLRAQQYSYSLRINATDAEKQPITAVAINRERLRLWQNPISTRVLDGMLGAIVLCLLVGGFITKTKNVLPKNPCSIAAVASLLADSSIMGRDFLATRQNKDWMDEKELEHLFWKRQFRMGYFDGADTGSRTFKIDIADADSEKLESLERDPRNHGNLEPSADGVIQSAHTYATDPAVERRTNPRPSKSMMARDHPMTEPSVVPVTESESKGQDGHGRRAGNSVTDHSLPDRQLEHGDETAEEPDPSPSFLQPGIHHVSESSQVR